MMRARTIIRLLPLLIAGALLLSCSTTKNTSGTRFYHSATAHFNTLHNGRLAYEEGIAAQEKGHVDNYTELLPMFVVADKKTAAMGKGNFETAIEKSQKAIKKHSIKRKPKRPSGRMSAKQKAFYNRHEFNPYLHHAWMMMADAQFHKGEFIEAAASYNYMIRLYADQPDVAERKSVTAFIINSDEDMEIFKHSIYLTANPDDALLTPEQVLNLTAFGNPNATYADLCEILNHMTIEDIANK